MKNFKSVLLFVGISMACTHAFADATTGACDKEAISAAKGFASDDGDEACVKEKAAITNVVNQRNQKEWVYTVHVDCSPGTSFTETVLLDPSCTVLNPQ